MDLDHQSEATKEAAMKKVAEKTVFLLKKCVAVAEETGAPLVTRGGLLSRIYSLFFEFTSLVDDDDDDDEEEDD